MSIWYATPAAGLIKLRRPAATGGGFLNFPTTRRTGDKPFIAAGTERRLVENRETVAFALAFTRVLHAVRREEYSDLFWRDAPNTLEGEPPGYRNKIKVNIEFKFHRARFCWIAQPRRVKTSAGQTSTLFSDFGRTGTTAAVIRKFDGELDPAKSWRGVFRAKLVRRMCNFPRK